MSTITLRKENVVKIVASEEAALKLELRGFVRDGTPASADSKADGNALLEKELAETKEQLAAANKEIATLKQELQGTKEQLEAAVKKAASTTKKKESSGGANDT